MLLPIVIAWLVLNALLLAFLFVHPLRHLGRATGERPPSAERGHGPAPQRSVV